MLQRFQSFTNVAAAKAVLASPVLAIGNFDGVHIGHQRLLTHARDAAQKKRVSSGLLTFAPHPVRFFRPDTPFFELSSPGSKARAVSAAGADGMVTLAFTADMAAMSADDFTHDLLARQLGVAGVVVGADFHYGHRRAGTAETLLAAGIRCGFEVIIVEPIMDDGEVVSSTRIRKALAAGDVASANRLLGRRWSIEAEVLHGDKRGRELGYPTANLHLEPGCGLKHGIYAVEAFVDGVSRGAVASFGSRPTFDNGPPKLEVHVFDFSGDLYGQRMEVRFAGFIRPELKFDSVEALIRRMDEDSAVARHILKG
jgi:riboflavin kinase / FMN adenylyltransferase